MFHIKPQHASITPETASAPTTPQLTLLEDPHFKDARQALTFATEILRLKQFPQISRSYQTGTRPTVVASGGEPAGATAHTTALSVYQCVHRLPDDAREILQLHVWGDYVTPQRFRAASALQEQFRRDGKRVRLSHRYSQRQLATLLDISKSTAARRLDKAFIALEHELQAVGLVNAMA